MLLDQAAAWSALTFTLSISCHLTACNRASLFLIAHLKINLGSAAIMRRRGSKSYSLQSSPFRKVAVQPMMPFVRRGFSE
jgi:hypothetical protein